VRQHVGGGLAEADGETARRRTMFGREARSERFRLLVEQEVDRALAVQGDVARLVLRHGGEAEVLQVGAHRVALALRRSELVELETVDPHRVLEGGDGHSKVRLCAHGDSGLAWGGPTL